MTHEEMTHEEIVMKLVGEIQPVGETTIDDERFDNLQTMCGLVSDLLGEIHRVSANKERYEFSIKRAGKYAHDFLTGISF